MSDEAKAMFGRLLPEAAIREGGHLATMVTAHVKYDDRGCPRVVAGISYEMNDLGGTDAVWRWEASDESGGGGI